MTTYGNPGFYEGPRPVFMPVTIPATSASVVLMPGAGVRVGGFSLRETTGTASADVQLVDGSAATNTVIAEVTLTPGQSIREVLPGLGVEVRVQLFLIVNSGTVRGSLWVGDL